MANNLDTLQPKPARYHGSFDWKTVKTTLDGTGLALGAVLEGGGKEYRLCKASEALAIGELTEQKDVLTVLVDGTLTAAAAVGDDTVVDSAAFASLSVADGQVFFRINVTPGLGDLYEVIEVVDDDTIRLGADITTALTTSTEFEIFGLWQAAQSNTANNGLGVIGFAQVAVAINEYFWAQTRGLGLVAVDDSADPLVIGEPFVAGLTVGGTVEGFTAAATTADEAALTLGMAIADAAGDGDHTIPALINVGQY